MVGQNCSHGCVTSFRNLVGNSSNSCGAKKKKKKFHHRVGIWPEAAVKPTGQMSSSLEFPRQRPPCSLTYSVDPWSLVGSGHCSMLSTTISSSACHPSIPSLSLCPHPFTSPGLMVASPLQYTGAARFVLASAVPDHFHFLLTDQQLDSSCVTIDRTAIFNKLNIQFTCRTL
ncbi:hypothetical protein PoB_000572900 [Plakobranchus ocellatus]|uniref:Uncharacterized protein n=1 Tax=Plakobranchus ocellatus TaxID=259542 RepID=A0AAV3YAW7_9GAST|nr:hypothetical protein PoB_000572900 [Plakobranchus ocellatus]